MTRPAFRTLDGIELALPVDGDRWVLVPRGLARDELDLTWALEYEDVPLAPQLRDELGGDPWLDYSDGALLVPIDRWNARAVVEPALVGGCPTPTSVARESHHPPRSLGEAPRRRRNAVHAADVTLRVATRAYDMTVRASRLVVDAIALVLALSFAVAVGEWIVPLRDGMSGLELGDGAVLLPSGLMLAALSRRLTVGAPGRTASEIFSVGAAAVGLAFGVFFLGLGP